MSAHERGRGGAEGMAVLAHTDGHRLMHQCKHCGQKCCAGWAFLRTCGLSQLLKSGFSTRPALAQALKKFSCMGVL